MPEGHVIHRLAARFADDFGGRPVTVSSPQGRFVDSAARVTGTVMVGTEAHGKQLFLEFEGAQWIRIHLGIYGKTTFGQAPAPDPVGAVRLRLENDDTYCDLRGPAACELIGPDEKSAAHARLGPDPLRADADPAVAFAALVKSRRDIGTLLMEQSIVSGIGNIYRAEVLFRQGIDPKRPGELLTREEWDAIWDDLVALMRDGVKLGRIDTVHPHHMPEAMGREPRVDRHGGEVYVYRRAGQACLVCGTAVAIAQRLQRNVFWCPSCQPG